MIFKKYHKILQFKDVIKDINFKSDFKGLDDDGKPILKTSDKPIINFKGTVKLHGTNAGICYTPKEGIISQKRSSFLNPENLGNTHYGFNKFVQVDNKDSLTSLMETLYKKHCNNKEQIIIYGEWAGENIQRNVGISQGCKAFFIFDCQVYNPVSDRKKWIDISDYKFDIKNVYNINNFKTFSIDIDFNNPSFSQNDLISYTEGVEKLCPVADKLGRAGTGEGIVWSAFWKGDKYIFKVKGQKHSTSKVKKLAPIDMELLKNVSDFVEYACTPNRIEQGIRETEAVEKSDIGKLLRWVANDIISEETDQLKHNSLEWKNVAKNCSNAVRKYYFSKIK